MGSVSVEEAKANTRDGTLPRTKSVSIDGIRTVSGYGRAKQHQVEEIRKYIFGEGGTTNNDQL